VSLVAGPAEFTPVPRDSQQGRPARRPTGATGPSVAADQCVRAWEGAYRHYGRIWELTARAPKGDPAAAREMAAASRAVAAAWRAIEAATIVPWWTVAALQSAAAAFDEQAQKYDTRENNENPSHGQDR
jgi:hypothetical protein